jgi:ABC-type amino acid transport system permease subunit
MATIHDRKKLNIHNSVPDIDEGLPSPDRNTIWTRLYGVPWWAVFMAVIGAWIAVSIAADDVYSNIFRQLKAGVNMTLRVSTTAFALAMVIGLIIGLIRSNPPRPQKGFVKGTISLIQLFIYNAATFFVEVMRGLPILIVLLVFAYVIIPELKKAAAAEYGIKITFRSSSPETAIIALSMTYGAFLSEIFRSGIQSIERGQIEAARSLGMTWFQTMRFVVLPQAIRRIIPPLGNDFVAMIKDSSLVAILGIRDVTQIAKLTSGSSFLILQTYLTVAVIYLSLTVLGSIMVKYIERRLKTDER